MVIGKYLSLIALDSLSILYNLLNPDLKKLLYLGCL